MNHALISNYEYLICRTIETDKILEKYRKKITDRQIEIDEILEAVCKHYSLEAESVTGNARQQEKVLARHVFAFLARKLTHLSTSQIGKKINRDHASVIHYSKQLNNWLEFNQFPHVFKTIEIIEDKLRRR